MIDLSISKEGFAHKNLRQLIGESEQTHLIVHR